MEIVLILLAAGDSKRFHGNKLLHFIDGKRMYEYVADEVEGIKELFCHRIVVTKYPAIIQDLKNRGYDVLENRQSFLGISHSISLALEQVKNVFETSSPSLCFAVCDQPYLKRNTIKALIEGFLSSKKGIGCLSNQGELGNPVIFMGHYREELLTLKGDVGGKQIVKQHLEDVYQYEVENKKELIDVDQEKF